MDEGEGHVDGAKLAVWIAVRTDRGRQEKHTGTQYAHMRHVMHRARLRRVEYLSTADQG